MKAFFTRFLVEQLARNSANTMVLLVTMGIVLFSVCFTSVALMIFQGYVDLLGIIISIAAPTLIFPFPARIFFTVFIRLHTAEEELLRKNAALEKALKEVKTLSGLLPVCCSCKKIRDDQGYWKEVEQFFCDRLDLQMSHGFCPECVVRLYPEMYPAAPVEDKSH